MQKNIFLSQFSWKKNFQPKSIYIFLNTFSYYCLSIKEKLSTTGQFVC